MAPPTPVWADPAEIFERAERAVADATLQRNLNYAADHERGQRRAIEATLDWQSMRAEAKRIREDAIANLPQLLDELQERVEAAGGSVFRAIDATAANEYVLKQCRARSARSIVKGKSMLTEEIELNAALEEAGIEVTETDLGEYIVQQRSDHPSHIRAPAVHLNTAQVAELFTRLGGEPLPADDPQELLDFARARLREKFLGADVGISGANFAVAETGTIIVVESEGNIRMSSALPRCHIVLMGIEKVVRDWQGAAHLVQVLPLAAHGERLTSNASFITGPARNGDDGPEEFHLVLVDNGRTKIAASKYREVLNCIRCGACLAACPVYRQVGGHTYGSNYSGPIGAVITPLLSHGRAAGRLADLSSLCGACRDACPVDIPLDDQLIMLRRDYRHKGSGTGPTAASAPEKLLFEAWARLWSKPPTYRASAKGGRALRPLLKRWTADRELRDLAREPFHSRWNRNRDG